MTQTRGQRTPVRRLVGFLLVAIGVAFCNFVLISRSVVIAAAGGLAVFSVSTLLVVGTPEFDAWRPSTAVGRIAKGYVAAYYSVREGRGKVILRWAVGVVVVWLLGAALVWTVMA